MLESSFRLSFFLKRGRHESKIRSIYLRITVDGIPKETSTKRLWENSRWDQKTERAIGNKEDARSLNFFLDSLILKINEYKTEIMCSGKPRFCRICQINPKEISDPKIMQPICKMI